MVRLTAKGEEDKRYKKEGEHDYRSEPRGKYRDYDRQNASRYVNVRITPNEQEMIKQAARRRGITTSKYILYLVRADVKREKEELEKKKNDRKR